MSTKFQPGYWLGTQKVVTLRAVGTPGIPEEGHDVTTIEFWNLGSVMLVL